MPVLQNPQKNKSSRAGIPTYTYDLRNRTFPEKAHIGIFEKNQPKTYRVEKSESTETATGFKMEFTIKSRQPVYPLGYVDGFGLYNGYFAQMFMMDPKGTLISAPSSLFSTDGFALVRHYYLGGGSEYDLSGSDLIDRWRSNAQADLEGIQNQINGNAPGPSCDNTSQSFSGTVAGDANGGANGGAGAWWEAAQTIYDGTQVLNNSRISISYSCSMSTTCEEGECPTDPDVPISSSVNCSLTYTLSDRFANPTDRNGPFHERNVERYNRCRSRCFSTHGSRRLNPRAARRRQQCLQRCEEEEPPSEFLGGTPFNISATWTENYSFEISH